MPSSISFTDAFGATTLTNQKPFPGDRFGAWEPHTIPIGPAPARQSDGAISMFVFRTDYGASFELRAIPSLSIAGVSQNQVADRLIAHLMKGGTCAITTGDADSTVYPTCGLKPGSSPSCRLTDVPMLEYTLTLEVINLAAVPVQMVCRYANQ